MINPKNKVFPKSKYGEKKNRGVRGKEESSSPYGKWGKNHQLSILQK